MPSRKEIFSIYAKVLLAAGCTNIVRGYWWPEDEPMPGTAYPVAAMHEEEPEQDDANEPAGYSRDGIIRTWLFVETGVVPTDGLGGGWKRYEPLDDLADSIARELGRDGVSESPLYFSSGTVVTLKTFMPFYWYRSPGNLSLVAGELRASFKQTFS